MKEALALANAAPLVMSDAEKNIRSRELWDESQKKLAESQREFKKAHKNMMKARGFVTSVCNAWIVKGKAAPDSAAVVALRNTVRALKGKNLL